MDGKLLLLLAALAALGARRAAAAPVSGAESLLHSVESVFRSADQRNSADAQDAAGLELGLDLDFPGPGPEAALGAASRG